MDKNLKYKLRQELPAILNWAVEGCLMWYREGLKMPQSVQQATNSYQSEMDVISCFLDTCCYDCGEIQASQLYQAYKEWAKENGEYDGMSNTRFGREIANKFQKVRKKDGQYYIGVSLKTKHMPYNISVM